MWKTTDACFQPTLFSRLNAVCHLEKRKEELVDNVTSYLRSSLLYAVIALNDNDDDDDDTVWSVIKIFFLRKISFGKKRLTRKQLCQEVEDGYDGNIQRWKEMENLER